MSETTDQPLTHEDRLLVIQSLRAALNSPNQGAIGLSKSTVAIILEIVHQATVEIATQEYKMVMSGQVEIDASNMEQALRLALINAGWTPPAGANSPVAAAVLMLIDTCHEPAKAHGWWSDVATGEPIKRNVGELLMLVVSELAEAMEGVRKDLPDDKLPQFKMIVVELGDALIRIFDMAGGLGFREALAEAFVAKLAFNAQREDHKIENRRGEHGKRF